MNKEQISDQIQSIIYDQTGAQIKDTFKEMGLDSLEVLEIIQECEIQFKIGIEDEEVRRIKSVDQLVEIVFKNVNKVIA